MKVSISTALILILLASCNADVKMEVNRENGLPVEGTWRLVSGQTMTGKDTVFTDYTKGQEMIKIINKTHFAFLRHDLDHGKDPATATYSAGGGRYTLSGNDYTEKLDYFSDRAWEAHEFHFKVDVAGDTLVQTGIEKIDSLGIDQKIVEKYVREKGSGK